MHDDTERTGWYRIAVCWAAKLALPKHEHLGAHLTRTYTPSLPDAALARGWLLVALACLFVQSTVAPALGWNAAAWSPMHSHVALNEGSLPAHTHEWDAPGGGQPQCEARVDAAIANAGVLCVSGGSLDGSLFAAIALSDPSLVLAPPTDLAPVRAAAPLMPHEFARPVLLPPPIH